VIKLEVFTYSTLATAHLKMNHWIKEEFLPRFPPRIINIESEEVADEVQEFTRIKLWYLEPDPNKPLPG